MSKKFSSVDANTVILHSPWDFLVMKHKLILYFSVFHWENVEKIVP